MRGRPTKQGMLEQALALRLQGLSYAEIGRQMGVSRQRVQQLTSPSPSVRRFVGYRALWKCQACGTKLGTCGHVHHTGCTGKTPDNYNEIENLQYLCTSCHTTVHAGG